MKKKLLSLVLILALLGSLLCGCVEITIVEELPPETHMEAVEPGDGTEGQASEKPASEGPAAFDYSTVPPYDGTPYAVVNGNQPFFRDEEITTRSFESYAPRDELERCGTAFACVGEDIMPTEKRESISEVKPTGWINVEYDFVDGRYLYNRCHLIGFQLTGENANWENLITGTRYFNVQGMLPFENMAADYVKETGNHLMYRVTPIFLEDELVARGVLMEAMSAEDRGEDLNYCVFVYNVQPGVAIDYSSGYSALAEDYDLQAGEVKEYILNTNSKKFHRPDCSGAENMKAENRQVYRGSREDLIAQGYSPCGSCKP